MTQSTLHGVLGYRAFLHASLRSCTKLRGDVSAYVEIEQPEPTEEDVAQVRQLIGKVAEAAQPW